MQIRDPRVQIPISETTSAMTPSTPSTPGEWEVTALRDRFGNIWDLQFGNRVQLRTAKNVTMKRAQAEVDYGPLVACEVNDIDGLIEDHQLLRERYFRAREQESELARQLAILKAEVNDQHAVEGGPVVDQA